MNEIKIDGEFQSRIPPLTDDEFQRLEKSILEEGVRESIITWNGTIIDGHNRYRICQKHGIDCPNVEREFENRDDAVLWIIRNQLSRRNLPVAAIGFLKLEEKEIVARQSKERQGRRNDLVPNLAQSSDEGRTLEILAKDIPLGKESLRKLDVIKREAESGNETAIKVCEELQSGEKKSIHGCYVRIVGKEKPRHPKDTVTDDGRKICVMCGEPINNGEAHAARPTVHKKCEQEYQRDWEKSQRKHLDAEKDLRENVAIYTVESLLSELTASANNMRQAWNVSIEINESMGVELTSDDKKQLGNAVENLFNTIQRIRGKHENV